VHSTSQETRLGERRSEFARRQIADVSAQGDGAQGLGLVQAVRSLRAVAESTESRRRVRFGVVAAAVGEGDGGAAEGDIERRGDAELQREENGGGAGGGGGAEGVGGAGGARRFDHVRVASAWREPSQTDSVQVRNTHLSHTFALTLCRFVDLDAV